VRADFPEDVKAPVQHGDTIASPAAYLQTRHCIPEDRLAQMFSDIHKIRIGPATLANLIARKAHGLRTFAEKVKALPSSSAVPVKHLDETGYRIAGKTRRLHVLRSKSLGHLRLGTGRGDIPAGLEGTAIHDFWAPYLAIETVRHGFCNAHLLRELQALIDHDREPWASEMKVILYDALDMTRSARKRGLPSVDPENVLEMHLRFDACCARAVTAQVPPCRV